MKLPPLPMSCSRALAEFSRSQMRKYAEAANADLVKSLESIRDMDALSNAANVAGAMKAIATAALTKV